MGRVKDLWQEEQDKLWQQFYDDYCFNNFGGRQPEGREHDEAAEAAQEALEEYNEANGQFGVGA